MMKCIKHAILDWRDELAILDDMASFVRDMVDLEGIEAMDDILLSENETGPWHTNLYMALYRTVLLGVVCCRAYNERAFIFSC